MRHAKQVPTWGRLAARRSRKARGDIFALGRCAMVSDDDVLIATIHLPLSWGIGPRCQLSQEPAMTGRYDAFQ